MNFSQYIGTLRSGNTYKQGIRPEMSVNGENISNTSDESHIEENDKGNERVTSETVEEKIRANLEALNEQISNNTKFLHQLMNDHSAKSTPMAGSGTNQSHTRS